MMIRATESQFKSPYPESNTLAWVEGRSPLYGDVRGYRGQRI
jgi:hypothetical protein